MAQPTTLTAARPRTSTANGWLAARALATVAAVAVALAAWTPWVEAIGTRTAAGVTRRVVLQLSPGDVTDVIGAFWWSGVTVAGALICPLLWARRDRLISRLAAIAYTLWMLAFMGLATSRIGVLFQPEIVLARDLGTAGLVVTSQRQLLPGLFFACAGTILSLIACFALFLDDARMRAGASTELRIVPVRSKLPAAGALTASVLCWLVATLVLPWATVGCPNTTLLLGTCAGMPYNAALAVGIRVTTTAFDPLAAKYAVLMLLAGSGALILVAIWRRRLTRRLCAWITLWLVACAGAATLARAGVAAVVANPAAQGLPAGAWSGDNGLACALLALLLGLVGVVYLWVAAVRAAPAGE